MGKRFRPQSIPPNGYPTEGTGTVPVPSRTVRTEFTLDGRVIRYLPKNRNRTGRMFWKAIPAGLQESARTAGYRLVNRATKYGTRACIGFSCETPEQAERDFKSLMAQLRRAKAGYPEPLPFGNNLPEPDKKACRRERKRKEKEKEEETHLGRLELLQGSVEELKRERERIECTSPLHLKPRRLAAIDRAITRQEWS